MSHEFKSGFSVRQPMWHGLGMVAERNPESVDEALQWAGADWEPVPTPVFHTKESQTCQSKNGCDEYAVATVKGTFYACGVHATSARKKGLTVKPLPIKQLGNYYAVTRSDTGDVLHVANSTYELFSNRETFELVELLLDSQAPQVKFETGGVLKEGRLVWALARVDEPIEVPGDSSPIYPYVSVLNSHDGSAALRAINTSVRIVCWNTWSAAESQSKASGREFSFRHTSSIRDRVEDARKLLLGARDESLEWAEYAKRMIAIPITDKQVDKFLAEFIPMPPDTMISDRVADNVHTARAAVRSFYTSASCASIAGTAWGLIQATGEFLDHGREWRTRESYVGRTLLRPEKAKGKVISMVEELVSTP